MNVHAAVKKLNKVQRSVAAGILFLLVLITAFYIAAKISAGAELRAAADKGGTWELSDGSWYYRGNLAPRNGWLDECYFIDESGRMVTGEWIYTDDDGTLQHSKTISCSAMAHIDMDNLCYVGDDGLKVKNKQIYYTPIKFDSDGRCSLSIDDFHFIDGTDSGLDGLRRYIIVNDGCKEYY